MTKGIIRQVPTFSEFTTKKESVLQVYYYLLGCSRPGQLKDFNNHYGEISSVKQVRTFEKETGKITQICNYKGERGILDISVDTYKRAIDELVNTWITVKTKSGEEKKIRLLQRANGDNKKGYWTEFYIRPFDQKEFFFQWIQLATLRDLSLHSNNYLVLVYAHMMYLKHNKSANWSLPHTTCALNICRLAFKVKRANRKKELKIQECFGILKSKGLIDYEELIENDRHFYIITEVNDFVKNNFTTLDEIGSRASTVIDQNGELKRTTVRKAVQELESSFLD